MLQGTVELDLVLEPTRPARQTQALESHRTGLAHISVPPGWAWVPGPVPPVSAFLAAAGDGDGRPAL